MNYLLDTCAISELTKPRPHPALIQWVNLHAEEHLFLSVVTIGEIQKGISKLAAGPKRQRLQAWLETDLRRRFQGRILPIDEDVAQVWGMLQGTSETKGVRLPVMDGWIAATARAHNLIVVTRNAQDLERCGAVVENPWLGSSV